MKELDFLFIYEHKVRELENVCLMKYELDRRGYKTEIVYIEDAQNGLSPKPIYHTKVLCMMACYNNHTIRWHTKDYVKYDKIIDLQWENIVYPKDEEREGAFKNYIELGKEVVHVSWGQQNVKRLLNAAHIDPRKVKLVGHVGMDFLREPLTKYYTSREELFAKYNLPVQNKTILFASPYYGDSLDQAYIEDMCFRFGENWVDYYKFMCDSQKTVLEWFASVCEKHPEITIVFRPHPGHPSIMAEEIQKMHSNFRIIGGESVKQWIVCCDGVYTGNSSVIVEAFFAKKMCHLLFPLPTTDGFELKLIADSKKINTYEGFYDSLFDESIPFPTPQESIEEIYLIDWEVPNYVKFADMAEEVLNDDYYTLTKEQKKSVCNYSMAIKIIKAICRNDFLYNLYLKLLYNKKIDIAFFENQRKLRQKVYDLEKEYSHELTTQEEINTIIKRISNALSN